MSKQEEKLPHDEQLWHTGMRLLDLSSKQADLGVGQFDSSDPNSHYYSMQHFDRRAALFKEGHNFIAKSMQLRKARMNLYD